MQTIRAWLAAHPDKAAALMDENPSYVFFRRWRDGPLGAQGVVLTAGRSLAVDRAFLPLGVPLWLDLEDAAEGMDGCAASLSRRTPAVPSGVRCAATCSGLRP